MTYDEIVSILGQVDDELVAGLIATGATARELQEAWDWLHHDDVLLDHGRPLPGTRVARLIDLLQPDDDDDGG